MKVYLNGQGHMTKMAVMAINSKNLKYLLLQNQKAYDFETWHEASGDGVLQNLYKSLDDIDLFYGQANLGRPCNGMGENRKMSFKDRKLARNEPMDRRVMLMKIVWAQGVVCPCPWAIIMYMTKISFSLKPLGQSKPNFMWSILRKSE